MTIALSPFPRYIGHMDIEQVIEAVERYNVAQERLSFAWAYAVRARAGIRAEARAAQEALEQAIRAAAG
jgi:hypothetical protein